MFYRVEIILEDDVGKYLIDVESLTKLKDFHLYICHLFKTHKIYDNKAFQVFNYLDFFQVPLQPLRDNLQSQTYEVFEDVGSLLFKKRTLQSMISISWL